MENEDRMELCKTIKSQIEQLSQNEIEELLKLFIKTIIITAKIIMVFSLI